MSRTFSPELAALASAAALLAAGTAQAQTFAAVAPTPAQVKPAVDLAFTQLMAAPGGFHALSEWIDVTDGWKGAQNSLVTVLGLVGVQGVSEPLLQKRPPRAAATK